MVADTLRAAKALIDTPEKWSRKGGLSALGPIHGEPTRCAGIAIHDVCEGAGRYRRQDAALAAFLRANGIEGSGYAIAKWNDAPERTHDEVMAAFDRAIALAEQEASS